MNLVLGLEIHIQVNSKKKMFCGCSSSIWQAKPNTHTCPVCLGLPGALPVPNFEAIKKAQLLGLALNCSLRKESNFDRKHYFYPDLPKGYQISQYKRPFCENGYLDLKSGKKAVIDRVHLEEDTAKSFHDGLNTLIDFNKSGIPLIEIVTSPCFTKLSDAVDFCKKIQDIVRVCDVSDADMEKGNMRLEANISMRTKEMEDAGVLPKYKVEVKNINSFRFMEKAVIYEMRRQEELLAQGEMPKQENRGWDERKQKTVLQRDKEEAHDYRYFPDPDIPPMSFTDIYIQELETRLPKLPYKIKEDLISVYKLRDASAEFFSSGVGLDLVQKLLECIKAGGDPQSLANLLINRIETRGISVTEILDTLNKTVITEGVQEDFLSKVIDSAISSNPDVVESYKNGKGNALQFLIGCCMRELRGKVDPTTLSGKLKERLGTPIA